MVSCFCEFWLGQIGWYAFRQIKRGWPPHFLSPQLSKQSLMVTIWSATYICWCCQRSWADLTEVSSVCMAACKIFFGLYWQTKFKYKAALPSESFSRAVLHLAAHLLLTHAKLCCLTIIIVTRVAGEVASGVHDDWTTIDRDSIVLIPIKVISIKIYNTRIPPYITSITSLSSRDVWRRNVIVNLLFKK